MLQLRADLAFLRKVRRLVITWSSPLPATRLPSPIPNPTQPLTLTPSPSSSPSQVQTMDYSLLCGIHFPRRTALPSPDTAPPSPATSTTAAAAATAARAPGEPSPVRLPE